MASSAASWEHCLCCGRAFANHYSCPDCHTFAQEIDPKIEILTRYCSSKCLEAGFNSHSRLCPARTRLIRIASLLRTLHLIIRELTFDLDVESFQKHKSTGRYTLRLTEMPTSHILAPFLDHLPLSPLDKSFLLSCHTSLTPIVVFSNLLPKLLKAPHTPTPSQSTPTTLHLHLDTSHPANDGKSPLHRVLTVHLNLHNTNNASDASTYLLDPSRDAKVYTLTTYEGRFVKVPVGLEKFDVKLAKHSKEVLPLEDAVKLLSKGEQGKKVKMLAECRDVLDRVVSWMEDKTGKKIHEMMGDEERLAELVELVQEEIGEFIKRGKRGKKWRFKPNAEEIAEMMGVFSFGSDEEVEIPAEIEP